MLGKREKKKGKSKSREILREAETNREQTDRPTESNNQTDRPTESNNCG